MAVILKSLYCIPCIWSVVCLCTGLFLIKYIRKIWVPFRGPMPINGPVDGFADDGDRMQFFDTSALRIRTMWKYIVIIAVVWAVGAGIIELILAWKG